MPRTLTWKHRIPEIRQRVENSVIETWSRRDIENLFELQRSAAQQLMKAIGEVQNIGGVYLVDRTALLTFLDEINQAENAEAARREKLLLAEPVPRPRLLKVSLPHDLRSVMVCDLPAEIKLAYGRLEITGADAEEIVERLCLLALAMQNDLVSACAALDPPPQPRQVEDDDLKAMFADLRRREEEYRQRLNGQRIRISLP